MFSDQTLCSIVHLESLYSRCSVMLDAETARVILTCVLFGIIIGMYLKFWR